jgi:hypothetical protein
MTGLIFSQSAIFFMQQLSSSYFRKMGVRYRISSEDGILTLLQKAAASSETEIRKNYDAFVLELNSRQIQALTEKGINLRTPTQSTVSWLQKVG